MTTTKTTAQRTEGDDDQARSASEAIRVRWKQRSSGAAKGRGRRRLQSQWGHDQRRHQSANGADQGNEGQNQTRAHWQHSDGAPVSRDEEREQRAGSNGRKLREKSRPDWSSNSTNINTAKMSPSLPNKQASCAYTHAGCIVFTQRMLKRRGIKVSH